MKVCALALGLWSVAAAGHQAPGTTALPAALRAHLQAERFEIVTSIQGLPLGVRDGMQTLFGGALDIAEPGAPFQVSDHVVMPNLPARRLVAAGCAIDHCLIHYQRGGYARTWHVALFYWTPEATRFEWGGTVTEGFATIADVRTAMLSGALKSSPGPW